ncbi:agmatinase [Desulfosarcina sp.]|uniref:agmatinase n=1 Tax=Desulfosarcina sp. TaxID=2027861 RepID=UPI0029A4E4F5|nr:agmatinase [Desulfosarcina sp.]MDX2452941.1 agmatinase [Desulfosarcina sp.]MDX2490675.1 agmatinase [Desulfosarcina sp.]
MRKKGNYLMIDNPDNIFNTELNPDTVALIGIPFDEYSSFMRGPAKAPSAIRQTLHNGSSNLFAENGVNLESHSLFCDLGDLALPRGEDAMTAIETAVGRLAEQKARVLALGGDHAVTFPVVKALTNTHDNLTILHLDAHPDLYDSYDGSRFSHACPFARIMETGRVKRLVQVGIRGMNDEQRRQVDKFGVTCIEMKDYRSKNPIVLEGPLYLSVDMDVLDPAYAPGVSHHEPGGMSTRKVLRLIQSIQCPIVGADIVEYNPDRDVNGMTAAVAAKLVKEIAGVMIRQVK